MPLGHEHFMRLAIEEAARGGGEGNMAVGSLVVQGDRVVAYGRNREAADGDPTAHAEMVAVREAVRMLGSASLAGLTLYTTWEPCPMCAGAIYWGGIRRVVYALSVESMIALAGPGADEIRLSCRDVLARGTRPVEVLGPALEDEARRVFKGYRR